MKMIKTLCDIGVSEEYFNKYKAEIIALTVEYREGLAAQGYTEEAIGVLTGFLRRETDLFSFND